MIRCLMAKPEAYDLLIVDDGSPDGTAQLVREEQKRFGERLHLLERSGKLGLGSAYIAGFKFALEHVYDRIFEMDCDFSHNPDDLKRLDAMLEAKDVAIGSRYSVGVNVVNWPLGRLLMSYFASKYVRLVTRMPVADATAGFVGYRREVLEAIDLDRVAMNGYGFQIDEVLGVAPWLLGRRGVNHFCRPCGGHIEDVVGNLWRGILWCIETTF